MVEFAEELEIVLSETDIAALVASLADRLAPSLSDDTVAVCLLTGGLWFAADLTRALARRGRHLGFDALWLSTYGDATASTGRCQVHAAPQRSLAGRDVLILDDVFDSGLTILEARRLVTAAGARRVTTAVFARKPWPTPRACEPDHVAWEAPARFLVGYGMDAGGRFRALPYVAAAE